jgi:NifU-like protein involved in Fe-S cluster formation
MHNETITFYSKTPPNKWELDDYDISFWEENRTCWDDLKVYIKLENWVIKKWSFQWDTAIITTACASIFGESIIGLHIEEIFEFGYKYIEELIEMPISDRRKQASVLWLLTTRNALHLYLKDWVIDTFDTVLAL